MVIRFGLKWLQKKSFLYCFAFEKTEVSGRKEIFNKKIEL